MTDKYKVGNVVDTIKGKIQILDYVAGKRFPDGKRQHPRASIKILKTGTVLNVQTTNIAQGKFSDYREPTVYGIGYIGSQLVIPQRGCKSVIRRIYDLWANMLKRAYGGYKTSYKGVTVDVRWHNFTHFLNTISNVPDYEKWEQNEQRYVLDKDIKTQNKERQYSMDTCLFVLENENIREGLTRRWHKPNALV